ARDSFGHTVRHDAVDRAAIISTAAQDYLERADVRRIGEQLSSRLEIVKDASVVAPGKIGRIQICALVENAPFVPRRERIGRMKERIVQGPRRTGKQRQKKG